MNDTDQSLLKEELIDAQAQIRALSDQTAALAVQGAHPELRAPGAIRTTFRHGSATAAPAAWTVRRNAVTENGQTEMRWQIFCPVWILEKREVHFLSSGDYGWVDMPSLNGVVYAEATFKGQIEASGEEVWSPHAINLTTSRRFDVAPTTTPLSGVRYIYVPIGRFETVGGERRWTQWHTGVLTETVEDKGGGGGASAVPGPLTYDEDTNRFVRRMGTYAQDVNGAWLFTAALDASGQPLPPVESYPAIAVLHRGTETPDPKIRVTLAADVGPADRNVAWLSKREEEVSGGVQVTPPASDTDTGDVSEVRKTLVYFSDEAPESAKLHLLNVQVAEANEATSYEQGE